MSPSLLPTPWQSPWSEDHPAQWWPRAPRGATWSCPRWARAPWRSPGFPGVAGGLCTARTRSRSCQAWVRATPWPESGQDNLTSSLTAILCYSLWWTPVSQRFSGWSPSRLWKTEKGIQFVRRFYLEKEKQTWGHETSTCSNWPKSLDLLDLSGLITLLGLSFWMIRDLKGNLSMSMFVLQVRWWAAHLKCGQRTAMSDRSNPLHWIFSPFSWPPTSSRQWTIFSTWKHIHVIVVFKKYINAMLELCNDIYHDILKREEGEARPMTKYSRVEAPGCKLIFLSHIGDQDVLSWRDNNI